jgi:hypothetical protein
MTGLSREFAPDGAAHDLGDGPVLGLGDPFERFQHVGRQPKREKAVVLHVRHRITWRRNG